MKDCATVFGLPYSPQEIPEVAGSGSSNERLWRTIVTIHYLSFRALYEGRSGEDSTAKACIAKLFIVMDMAEEKGTLRKLRANGGIVKVSYNVQVLQLTDRCCSATRPAHRRTRCSCRRPRSISYGASRTSSLSLVGRTS